MHLRLDLEVVGIVVLRLEVAWLLETVASRIDHRYDGQGDSSIGKRGTASATFISTSNSKEILIGDMMTVASRLKLCSHK